MPWSLGRDSPPLPFQRLSYLSSSHAFPQPNIHSSRIESNNYPNTCTSKTSSAGAYESMDGVLLRASLASDIQGLYGKQYENGANALKLAQ